jgi:hypothetical protein
MNIRYWVLRGDERWIVYRDGSTILEGDPTRVEAFLAKMRSFGAIIVYGD